MADKKKQETPEEAKANAKPETAENAAKADESAQTEAKQVKETPAKSKDTAKAKPAGEQPAAKTSSGGSEKKGQGKRAEKVGIVWSDKMTKTVVVRAERLVKHRLYHKYMKRRKKFMAHNELGATEGDRVRIVETRPMSARKRWRVVEIIQKAEK
ncbi:MAG: 30S ribosomal protein S17 [Pyrinomonadaceae bacterium]|nr:30S ribosomal protein S17 [Pyrinomonadaceae bacterium]